MMKHIKLFEGFVNDYNILLDNYLSKIDDCILYLSDNYKVDTYHSTKNHFVIGIVIKNNDDIDNLKDNYLRSIERVKNDLDGNIKSISIHYEHDGWSSFADGQSIDWVISKAKLLKSNELYKIVITIEIP